MKRFMVFIMEMYYPSGGMDDFLCTCNTREEALVKLVTTKPHFDVAHILDLTTGTFERLDKNAKEIA